MFIVTEGQPEKLSAPTDLAKSVSDHDGSQRCISAPHRALVQDVHLADGLVKDVGAQAAPHGFNFGQFGHVRW
jgi:hypothetical protein